MRGKASGCCYFRSKFLRPLRAQSIDRGLLTCASCAWRAILRRLLAPFTIQKQKPSIPGRLVIALPRCCPLLDQDQYRSRPAYGDNLMRQSTLSCGVVSLGVIVQSESKRKRLMRPPCVCGAISCHVRQNVTLSQGNGSSRFTVSVRGHSAVRPTVGQDQSERTFTVDRYK